MVRRFGFPDLRKVILILLMETDHVFVKLLSIQGPYEDLSTVRV